MRFDYFPGCTLKNRAKELDEYAHRCADALGVTLQEIENWQCCGGAFTSDPAEVATKLSSVRLLREAEKSSKTLVTVCSACYNVVKQTAHAMETDPEFANRVDCYMADEGKYNGGVRVCHYLELLRDDIGFDKLSEKTVNPLKGKRIAPYYGCLLLRPSSVLRLDDPENPAVMEDMIRAVGGEPVYFGRRNECCGGYVFAESESLAKRAATAIWQNAVAQGADMMITACPLCMYNLKKSGCPIPVLYFTELLAEALGVKEEQDEQ